MEIVQIVLPMIGAALCAWAAFQLAGWTKLGPLSLAKFRRKASSEKRKKGSEPEGLVKQKQTKSDAIPAAWQGFRTFKVAALEPETNSCASVYLMPCDEKPIPEYQPGQHLTLKFETEEGAKPLVRCYSLSSSYHPECYRISVKAVASPQDKPDVPPGRVSNFINSNLRVGQHVEVKAPAGSFYLNEDSQQPVVLLAAGVGITPMMSMIETLVAQNSTRGVLLLYGVTDSTQHIFGTRLKTVSLQHKNISVINCYSEPLSTDRPNEDYQVRGRVSAELVNKVLPHIDYDYYLCGPPAFMESLYDGLQELDVNDDRIFYEAFGPATIKRVVENRSTDEDSTEVVNHEVKFNESGCFTSWTPSEHNCILDVAESKDVMIDSGCRAGSCGTCETGLLAGEVKYPGHDSVNCMPGKCLPCVAVPVSNVELEA